MSSEEHAMDDSLYDELSNVARDITFYEESQRRRVRDWLDVKLLRWALKGLHRTAVGLTRRRHHARAQRAELVRELLTAGQDVVQVMHRLVERLRGEQASIKPLRDERKDYREMQTEILARAGQEVVEQAEAVRIR